MCVCVFRDVPTARRRQLRLTHDRYHQKHYKRSSNAMKLFTIYMLLENSQVSGKLFVQFENKIRESGLK